MQTKFTVHTDLLRRILNVGSGVRTFVEAKMIDDGPELSGTFDRSVSRLALILHHLDTVVCSITLQSKLVIDRASKMIVGDRSRLVPRITVR